MRPDSARALALAVPFVLAACLFGGEDDAPSPDGPYHDRSVAKRIASIQQGLSQVRGLAFTRPLRSALITSEAYRRQVEADIDQSVPAPVDHAISREMAQLGFFRDTTARISAFWKDFYGSFPGGYYIPGRDSIYIIAEHARDEEFMSVALPHELVHALQDQAHNAFDSERFVGAPGYYYGDFDLARRCLIEGDAEFTAYAYYAKHVTGDAEPFLFARNEADRRMGGYLSWKALPDSLRLFAPAGSPYEAGMRHVSRLHARGGLAAVDSAYLGNGRTTLETLTGHAGAPQAIDLDWLPSVLDTAGAYVDDFGHGSLHTMSLFLPDLTQSAFERGMGWRGDRCFFRIRARERWGDLVWVQVYADAADAEAAMAGLEAILPKRFANTGYSPIPTDQAGPFDEGFRIQGMGLTSILARWGREVWWVEGVGAKPDEVIAQLADRRIPKVAAAAGRALAKESAAGGGRSRMLGPDLGRVFFHPYRAGTPGGPRR